LAFEPTDGSPVPIEKVRQAAAYQLVVDQIRRALQMGRYLPGDKLPPERELAGQLGVSRTTVREAIRVLEGEGLLLITRGRSGGITVANVDVSREEARRRVRAQLTDLENMFEFRIAVEGAAAKLAAERRTARDLAALGSAVDRMENLIAAEGPERPVDAVSRFFVADGDFHLGIARAARNPLIALAVEEARAGMPQSMGAIFTGLGPHANDFHRDLLRAIEAGNGDVALKTMVAHIEEIRATVRGFVKGGRR